MKSIRNSITSVEPVRKGAEEGDADTASASMNGDSSGKADVGIPEHALAIELTEFAKASPAGVSQEMASKRRSMSHVPGVVLGEAARSSIREGPASFLADITISGTTAASAASGSEAPDPLTPVRYEELDTEDGCKLENCKNPLDGCIVPLRAQKAPTEVKADSGPGKLFNLPASTKVVEVFSCAYYKKILLQGSLYVFDTCIGFYANILGSVTKQLIYYRDIASLKKSNTAYMFPNAITIINRKNKEHFFASFFSRERAISLISLHVRVARKTLAPVVAFINPKSGSGLGRSLINELEVLPGTQLVLDLANGDRLTEAYRMLDGSKIVVGGGDGTVCGILCSLIKMGNPPCAVIPLGTGNDFARSFGWGKEFNDDGVTLMHKVQAARMVKQVDIWDLQITGLEQSFGIPERVHRSRKMSNYFSIGFGARVTLDFQTYRAAYPAMYSLRELNKFWYANIGTVAQLSQFWDPQTVNSSNTELIIDGEPVELTRDFGELVVLNIPSYAAGTDIWGKDNGKSDGYAAQAVDDGKIEVIGLDSPLHLITVWAGLQSAQRLGQGAKVVIRLKQAVPVHVDGEAWRQDACEMEFTRWGQANVLCAPTDL